MNHRTTAFVSDSHPSSGGDIEGNPSLSFKYLVQHSEDCNQSDTQSAISPEEQGEAIFT